MRGRIAVFAIVAAAVIAALAGLSFAAPNTPQMLAQRGEAGAIAVDAEVVLAVDVSYSMDPDEQALQREGYMAALTSREFLQALKQGMHGRIAMTYFEWAGSHHQQIIVPWRLVDGPEVGRRLCRRYRPRALHPSLAHLDLQRAVVCRAAVRRQRLSRRPPRHRRLR